MAKTKGGLGREFFEIFDDNMIDSKKGAGEMIRVSDIEPRHDQPRKNFDREALESLADSVAKFGVIQPIVVRERTDFTGSYEIIAGERRWRAAKMAGLSEIPAVILNGDELKTAQIALVENLQRENLNAVEEALAYNALIERFCLTQEQVASQVGKSRSAITNTLRLLDLPDEMLELLKNGDISAGHARALLALTDIDNMPILANKIIEKGLSVREAEDLAKRMNAASDSVEEEDKQTDPDTVMTRIYMRDLERKSMSVLGRKVKIIRTNRKKVLELTYDNDDDLEALLTSICGKEVFDN